MKRIREIWRSVCCVIVSVAMAGMLPACGNSGSGRPGAVSSDSGILGSDSQGDASGILEMPEVPASLTNPTDRADYILLHFWDRMDFSSPDAVADSVMVEQAMSNFISVMDYCTPKGLEAGVSRLLDRASEGGAAAREEILRLAALYLWEADSPFRNERFYLPFAEYESRLGGAVGERAVARIAEINRNAPGSEAPGFSYMNPSGKTVAFKAAEGNVPTLLMFYQPDCEHCEEGIDALRHNAAFDRAVGEGRLRMFAIYIGKDTDGWKKHADSLPATWEIGIDREESIDNRDLYVVKATPSFYLISPDGRILLKDGGVEQLGKALGPYLR